MWLFALLVGCEPGNIALGDKSGIDDTDVDDTDDTDVDDTDVDDTHTFFSGTFAGTSDIDAGGHGGGGNGGGNGGGQPGRALVYCEGPFELALAADGSWAGTADCQGADGGFSGPITGVTEAGDLVGSFAYVGFGYEGEAAVVLARTGDALDGTVQDQDDGIAMSMLAEGGRVTP